VVEQRPRPGGEHRQPVADHPLLVVAPPAAQQPAPQLVVGNLQVAGRVEGGGARLQVAVQRLGLADGPREAVQDEAGGAVGLGEPLEHHPGHQRVGDQVAAAQERLGGLPERVAWPTWRRSSAPTWIAGSRRLRAIRAACVPFPDPEGRSA